MVNSIIKEVSFGSPEFYLREIGDDCENFLEKVQKYENKFNEMPESFSNMDEKEKYFEVLLDLINGMKRNVFSLNTSIKRAFGVNYSLNDYLNEGNRKFYMEKFDRYNREIDEGKYIVTKIKELFDGGETEQIKKFSKMFTGELVNLIIRLENYENFLRYYWKQID